jgi:putative acetyltransferase
MTEVIRAATHADREDVHRVVVTAFGDEGSQVSAMVEALDAAGHVRASLVAEVDGRIVGHVMLSHSWLDSRERLVDVLVLAPLAVAPAAQGKGLGTALLSAAVAEARHLGAPAVFLEGDPRFYGPRGWDAGTDHGFTSPSARIPGPAFQVQVLEGRQSWMTGALVYVEPFWALDCVGLRDPLLAQFEQMFDS